MIRPCWIQPEETDNFATLRSGFSKIFEDPHWLAKILLGGFLLINPFLVALAPAYIGGLIHEETAIPWVQATVPWLLGFNVLTFWFPLGFTYEVLRRARSGDSKQLPDWNLQVLPTYAYEGSVKLVISVMTLLLPLGIWMAACQLFFVEVMGLPTSTLSVFVPPMLLLVIPFCAVACCRWLDGDSVLSCAFNYAATAKLFRRSLPDYLLASTFLVGLNAILGGFFYTLPFATVFGLCLVDTWFGPIYAKSVDREPQPSKTSEAEDGEPVSRCGKEVLPSS